MIDFLKKKQGRTANFFFCDIVGLSDPRITTSKQIKKLEILNKSVQECDAFKGLPTESMILPTGDGMAIDFSDNATGPISLAIELQKKLHKYNQGKSGDDQVNIRIGMGFGTVFDSPDVKGNPNVWGRGIILARRVMDIGDQDHILIHQDLANSLKQDFEEYKSIIHDLGKYQIKHNEEIGISSIHSAEFGSNKIPQQKSGPLDNILNLSYESLIVVWKDPQMREEQKLKNLIKGVDAHNIDPIYMYWETLAATRWKRVCEDRLYEIHRVSRELLSKNVHKIYEIIKKDTDSSVFDFISLGAGGGEKDNIILQELINNAGGEKFIYFPLDQGFSMLSYAIDYVLDTISENRNVGLFAIYGDFTRMKTYQSLIQKSHNPKIYALLGNTLGNGDEELTLTQIKTTMKDSDRLILGVSLIGGRDNQELATGYDITPVRELLTGPLVEKLSQNKRLSDSFRDATVHTTILDEKSRVPGSKRVQVYLKADNIDYKFAYAIKYDLEKLINYLRSEKIRLKIVEDPIVAFDDKNRPIYAKLITRPS